MPALPENPTRTRRQRLLEVSLLFLRLGATAFGGPAAHIALMQDEVVRRRSWLSRDEFLDLLGATNLIPGPNSTELAIHIGHRRAGWPGLLAAGIAFILPAFLIVTAIGWAYLRFGNLPNAKALFLGVKPVIVVIIVQALISLGQRALKTRMLAVAGLLGTTLGVLGAHELVILFGTGAALATQAAFSRPPADRKASLPLAAFPIAAAASGVGAAATSGTAFGLWPLFAFFLKVGSVLFGSGYVLLAFLRADLVERWHWLTEQQLVDAIAVGQFTPGPVFTAATFIGYLLGGFPGALVATAGIFLPAFIFVALSGPLMPRLRASPVAGAFLDGVNVASLALMAVVTAQLAHASLVSPLTLGVAAVSAFLLFRYRINSAWLVLGGGVIGFLSSLG